MSRTVYLGITNKRLNSTLQPNYSRDYDRYNVVFKEGFDIKSPHLILSYDGLLPWYNHMYIPDVYTYYWITEQKALQNGRWELTAEVDTLATYRAAIVNTSAFIEYGFNLNAGAAGIRVTDPRPAVYKQPTTTIQTFDIASHFVDTKAGVYILSAVGKSNGVRNYALDKGELYKLLSKVNTDIDAALTGKETVEEILAYFTKNSLFQGSAINAIKNCVWLPFSKSIIGGGTARVYLGDFDTGVDAAVVAQDLYNFAGSTTLQWPAADWRRLNTQVLIYVPFFGTVALPVDQCNNAAKLELRYSLDCLAGNLAVKVLADSYTIYTSTTNIAASYAIGASNVPVQNLVNGTLSAIGGGIQAGSGIYTAGVDPRPSKKLDGASNVVGGIQAAYQGVTQAITPIVQCAGGVGGSPAAGIDQTCTIVYVYFPPLGAEALQAVYGYPVMQVFKPVRGYCKTRGFSVNASHATASEMSAINAAMDSGVFIDI